MTSSDTDPPGPPQTSFHCSPRHPGESNHAFAQRARAFRNAARQQYVEEYYREREARLPSPESYDREHQDRAEMVRHVEQDIYWDSRPPGEYWDTYEYPVQRAQRLGIPYSRPGLSLTDIEDNDDPYESRSMRPEDREWRDALGIMSNRSSPAPGTLHEAATSGQEGTVRVNLEEDRDIQSQSRVHKRKREPEEDADTQGSAKRARARTHAATSEAAPTPGHKRKRRDQGHSRKVEGPAKRARADIRAAESETPAGTSEATATSRHKRKRGQQEEDCSPQARNTRSHSNAKKRRTGTPTTTTNTEEQLPAIVDPGTKRKRVLDEPQPPQERAKRTRRTGPGKDVRPPQTSTSSAPVVSSPAAATNGTGEKKRNSSAAAEGKKSARPTQALGEAPKEAPRLTRAQRRLLSGEDAQLLQLGHHGEVDVQGRSVPGVSKDAAGKRRSARAVTGAGTILDLNKDGRRGKRTGQRKT